MLNKETLNNPNNRTGNNTINKKEKETSAKRVQKSTGKLNRDEKEIPGRKSTGMGGHA